MRYVVKKSDPTKIFGHNRAPNEDEFSFEDKATKDTDWDFYVVTWAGIPGESEHTVTRLLDQEVENIIAARKLAVKQEKADKKAVDKRKKDAIKELEKPHVPPTTIKALSERQYKLEEAFGIKITQV